MKTTVRLLLVCVVLAAGYFGLRHYLPAGNSVAGQLLISGNIEITDAELGFQIAGRVATREVDEGQPVQAGQVVARLETVDLEREVALREAELRAAKAVLAELRAGSRPEEIAQAEAVLASARAEAHRADLDLERQKTLRQQAVATVREYELAEATARVSAARVREAEERLALVRKGPRDEEIEQAEARVEQAREALGLARTRLGFATLSAPFAGLVLAKHLEPGEYASPGTPVVTVGDLEHPWLRAYIHETDLGRVKIGQRVEVTTDTYPGKVYEGRVTFLSAQAEFTPKNVQTQAERVKLVYRIKVELANPHQELKPGMPADARIRVEEAVGK